MNLFKQTLKKTWPTTIILSLLYLFFSIWFLLRWRMYNYFEPSDYLTYVQGLFLIFIFSESLNRIIKNNQLRSIVSALLIGTYYILGKYHFRVKTGLDYTIVFDNFFEAFNKEAAGVIFETLKPKDFYHAIGLSCFFYLISFKLPLFKRKYEFKKIFGIALFGLYLCSVYILPFSFGEISYFIKTSMEFHFPKTSQMSMKRLKEVKKRFFDNPVVSSRELSKPNIFIVSMESFNSLYVEKKIKNGKEVTPVFNSLISEGLYVDDFYGNSIQTIKGQFPTYCSRLPLMRGKSSYLLDGTKINCAPRTFSKIGYETYFHKCFNSLDFDNTGTFMDDIGFDHIKTTNHSLLTEKQKVENIWGWGVQDDISYIQFLDNFEKISAKTKKPIYSTIHTVSHHMKFSHVPANQKYLYKNAQNKKQDFENSLYLSDKYLGTFVTELKKRKLYENSLIIITGDHSYPAGEHGFYNNQVGFYQEFFKTPMLIIWKGKLKPKRISNRTFSQIDLTPTLIDLIGESVDDSFLGNSMLQSESHYSHLIQPYSGISLAIVKYPFKYVFDRRSGKELFFNLKDDPLESKNLKNHDLINSYRQELDIIYFNEENLKAKASK